MPTTIDQVGSRRRCEALVPGLDAHPACSRPAGRFALGFESRPTDLV